MDLCHLIFRWTENFSASQYKSEHLLNKTEVWGHLVKIEITKNKTSWMHLYYNGQIFLRYN